MAELELGSITVLAAQISIPRIGVWHADLTLETDTVPTGIQTLATDDGALSLKGTPSARSAGWQGRAEIRFVGGAGNLSRALRPKYYHDVTLRVILSDICRDTGETLSGASDTGILNTTFPKWTREAGEAGSALAQAIQVTGASWRILADGTLWVGNDTWPNVEIPGDIMEERPTEDSLEVATDTLYGLLYPGTTWDGKRVSYVEHTVRSNRSRTRVWFEAPAALQPGMGPPRDRAKSALDAIIRNVMRRALFHALYPAVVISQEGDGTLSVTPDSSLLPTLTGVPIRYGSPGRTLKVSPGARVLISFEGGDPAYPSATTFVNNDSVSELREHTSGKITMEAPEVKLGDGASRGVARMSDTVAASGSMAQWITTISAAVDTLVGGTPAFTPQAAALSTAPIGTISSASGKAKAE